MSLYEGAVKRPIMTSLVFLAVVILGVFSAMKLPIDLFPDIDTNTIMIMTYYNGASANDIENNVTRPLENTLNSIEHLKHITSNSRDNVSVVTLQFEYGYDINDLTNDVRDKLDMVSNSLPNDANQPVLFKFSSDIIRYSMNIWPIRWRVSMEWEACPSWVHQSVKSTSTWMRRRWRLMA